MSKLKWLWILMICVWGLTEGTVAYAKEAEYQETVIEAEGFGKPKSITDGNRDTFTKSEENGQIKISRTGGISGIYVEFDRVPKNWTLTDPLSGDSINCGEYGFLHEYVDVVAAFGKMPETLLLHFEKGTSIAEVYGFSEGTVPEWVQIWNPPCEEADLLLISSHSDDEQLFFAGILPYYTMERKLNVQVAYVVQHFEANNVENHQRPHEQLDGLWTVGVRNYPLMSDFPDLYSESKERQTAFNQASKVFESVGVTYDDFVEYFVECIRRCKPLVVVSHDLDGEYGHGTHVLCAAALTDAIEVAAQENEFGASADLYGTWTVEKTYLHLYEENPIIMDFDVPLESLGGKTAFEVSREGFGCHKSQHWTWFYKWMYGTAEKPVNKAADISTYSPCQYGLYDSKVGVDIIGGDFFENIQTYEERALEAARLEEEKRLAEEEAKAEEERARLEEQKAKQALEESQRLQELEEAANRKQLILLGVLAVAVPVAFILCIFSKKTKKRSRK